MTISMYSASVPVFQQGLKALSAVLTKAEAHATEKKIEPAALLQARLYPDMLAFTRQVQLSCDFAKRASARLAGMEPPKNADTEQSFAELQARISVTLDFLASLTPAQFEGSDIRELNIPMGPDSSMVFTGQNYLLQYALQNFFFHLTTAYDLLRHNGIAIGKRDFIGRA